MSVAKDEGPTTTTTAATDEGRMMTMIGAISEGRMMTTIGATGEGQMTTMIAARDEERMMTMIEKERGESETASAGDKSIGNVEGKNEKRNALWTRLQLRRTKPEV
jgi:hypothetical protein